MFYLYFSMFVCYYDSIVFSLVTWIFGRIVVTVPCLEQNGQWIYLGEVYVCNLMLFQFNLCVLLISLLTPTHSNIADPITFHPRRNYFPIIVLRDPVLLFTDTNPK